MRAFMGWAFAIALAVGCGKKTDNSAAKSVDKAGSAATAEGSGSAAGSGVTADKMPPPADPFDTHMKAGQALEDEKKWPEALAEFESALAAKKDDARCLDEVAFTAYWAGKLDRAKEAALAAAAAAKDDKKTHGQALFNLGLAVEKAQPYAAQQLYIASLAERPNKGVAARLAKLSKDKPEKKQSKDDLALLSTVGVKTGAAPAPATTPSSTPGSKEDQALMAALEGAGLEWEGAAGKSVLFVENVSCTKGGATRSGKLVYSCSNPKATDAAAVALIQALQGKGVKEVQLSSESSGFKVSSIRCRSFDEGDSGAPDECEVTP